jgi:diketogulonate reductase-like aldo/keto reductase
MTASPLLTLNNYVKMPALWFGTLDRIAPERIAGAVEAAIASGYRLIDTAASYAVERQVGEGIRRSEMVCPPSEKHWHAANATTGMSHIAIQEALDGKVLERLEKVSDKEYLAAPSAG